LIRSAFYPDGFYLKLNMGKWLSGRKRQTVNLLGNSRWFEPNLSQMSRTVYRRFKLSRQYIFKKRFLSKDRYLLTSANYMKFSKNLRRITNYSFHKAHKRTLLSLLGLDYVLETLRTNDSNNDLSSSASNFIYHVRFKKILYMSRRYSDISSYVFKNVKEVYLKGLHCKGSVYNTYALYLSFKRNRFFPYFDMTSSRQTIFNNSLGILSKRFSSKKSFLRGKSSYIMSASFIRRLLIFIRVVRLNLFFLKRPKYLKDILATINTSVNVFYQHPYRSETVNEKELSLPIYFEYINFINNKAYGPVKRKKQGRLKRKISKRVILYNNVAD
jgi:hypothetical protein